MIKRRPRIVHKETFEERLAKEAQRFKEAAEKQPQGSMARERTVAPRATSRSSFTHERLAVVV
jgi:hypothetical protein